CRSGAPDRAQRRARDARAADRALSERRSAPATGRHDARRGDAAARDRGPGRGRPVGRHQRARPRPQTGPLFALLQHVGPLSGGPGRGHAGGRVFGRGRGPFTPSASRGRRAVAAIMLTFALSSAITIGISIWATSRSHHRAAVIEVAARQRNLAERYVDDILLLRAGHAADPRTTAEVMSTSAHALLDGGTAPAVNGDDDEITLPRAADPTLRHQLSQEVRLVNDLIATGNAVAAGRPVDGLPQTAGENVQTDDPVERMRVLSALTSNVSLDASRTIAANSDNGINQLVAIQIGLGVPGLVVSLLLAFALVAA